MDCASRQKIKPFLEDLLSEEEYQEIREHLETCDSCKTHAAAAGSLAFQIRELGEIRVPPDIVSTVLYELRRTRTAPEKQGPSENAPASSAQNGVLILAVIFLAVLAAFFGNFYFKNRPQEVKAAAAVPVRATAAIDDPYRARAVLAVEKIKTIVNDLDDSAVSDEKWQKVKEALDGLGHGSRSLSDWKGTHWHYHLSSSSQSDFLQLVREMGLGIDHETPQLFILYVPKTKLEEFNRRINSLNGVVSNFGETDPSKAGDGAVQVSVYMMEK